MPPKQQQQQQQQHLAGLLVLPHPRQVEEVAGLGTLVIWAFAAFMTFTSGTDDCRIKVVSG